MAECFHCGVSDRDERLLEVVYKTGVNYLCKSCYSKFKLPIIERKRVDWKSIDNKRLSVRDKLSALAHVSPSFGRNRVEIVKSEQDEKLKELVEENFKRRQVVANEVSTELIDNFNWVIMRRRRSMKISHAQLAEKIHEPEVIISSLEKGVLPRDYFGLIRKIESVLSIKLFKESKENFDSNDIVTESKVPTGILLSEVKEKSGKFKNWFKKKDGDVSKEEIEKVLNDTGDEEIEAEELDLDKVEEIIGKPMQEDDQSVKGKSFENEEERKEEKERDVGEKKEGTSGKEDLSSEDIEDLVWRN